MNTDFSFDGRLIGPRALGTMTLGTAWEAVGTAMYVAGANLFAAFVDLEIHDSNNPRFRLRPSLTAGGSAYALGLPDEAASVVYVEDEYIELSTDGDQKVVLAWELGGVVPYVTLQACVGTLGGTAAYVAGVNILSAL